MGWGGMDGMDERERHKQKDIQAETLDLARTLAHTCLQVKRGFNLDVSAGLF